MSGKGSTGVIAGLDSIYLKSVPIEPSWILSGEPRARSGAHSVSSDAGASTTVWDCSAGAFNWHFGWDETVLILEGSVEVTSPEGKTTQLSVGDVAYFAAGTTWKWEISTYVRKLAFCRRPASRPERLMAAARRQLTDRWTAIRVAGGLIAAALALMYVFE